MISKILLCTAVVAATVAVILLSVLTPGGKHANTHHPEPVQPTPNPIPLETKQKKPAVISLYVQRAPAGSGTNADSKLPSTLQIAVFDQPLTEGPDNGSRVIGRAQGFALPTGMFGFSALNVFNLNINSSEYKGSVSVQGKRSGHRQAREELPVVGGTGYFAFATGFAVFRPSDTVSDSNSGADSKPLFHLKLHLRFPGASG